MKLDDNIERIQSYLTQRAKQETVYNELIEILNTTISNLETTNKPVVKIVSPSATLATKFQAKNQANFKLRSLYEFQAVSPISNLPQIVQNCDLICLIYYFKQNVIKNHQQLIRLAQQENITLVLLVKQPDKNSQDNSFVNWLNSQNYVFNNQVKFPLNNFINFNCEQHFKIYQQSLIELSVLAHLKFSTRKNQELKEIINNFIDQNITHLNQEIKYSKNTYLQSFTPYSFEQQLRRNINQLNKDKQQLIQNIKLNLNQTKANLLNPFMTNSLMAKVQQMIYDAQLKIVPEKVETSLYLTLQKSNGDQYIHDYVMEICQEKVDEIIDWQWSQINNIYGRGGLKALLARTYDKLNMINPLLTSENELSKLVDPGKYPNLDLEQIINYDLLKFNSRITFDFHFSQSSWFRLVISAIIGLGIYLFTLIYFGSGKYIGFVIVIFQIINLITGQNIKSTKLKQHSKELKRTVQRNYQNLIRLVIEQSIQTLILAVDRESQRFDNELENIMNTVYLKLDQIKDSINLNQSRIDNFKQDHSKISAWFD